MNRKAENDTRHKNIVQFNRSVGSLATQIKKLMIRYKLYK